MREREREHEIERGGASVSITYARGRQSQNISETKMLGEIQGCLVRN